MKECSLTYHLPCGIANGAFNHYHHQCYPSYCAKHRPKSDVPPFKGRRLCTICQVSVRCLDRWPARYIYLIIQPQEQMKNADRSQLLFIQCCQSYFHRDCVAMSAYHQGYNLKCPNCNNVDQFGATVMKAGIYVPSREATWILSGELVPPPVSFQCNAPDCLCVHGRDFNGDDEWELFTCDRCGSAAAHVVCVGLSGDSDEWF